MFKELELEQVEALIAKSYSHESQVLCMERQSALTPCLVSENKLQD